MALDCHPVSNTKPLKAYRYQRKMIIVSGINKQMAMLREIRALKKPSGAGIGHVDEQPCVKVESNRLKIVTNFGARQSPHFDKLLAQSVGDRSDRNRKTKISAGVRPKWSSPLAACSLHAAR